VNKDACGMQLEFIGKCVLVSWFFYRDNYLRHS